MNQFAAARRARSGHLTAEALIIIPILMTISVGIIEFGLLLSLKQSVAHAAVRGAREAAKGAALSDVNDAVETSLSGFDVTLASNAGLAVEDPENTTTPLLTSGSITCDLPTVGVNNGNIRVTVCVASTGAPISGLLQRLGVADFMTEILTGSAVAKKECP